MTKAAARNSARNTTRKINRHLSKKKQRDSATVDKSIRKTPSVGRSSPSPSEQSRPNREASLRLRRACGHLEKVIKMSEAGAEVSEILQQLSAVIAALGGCRTQLFTGQLKLKLRSALRGGHEPLIDEIEKLTSRVMRAN